MPKRKRAIHNTLIIAVSEGIIKQPFTATDIRIAVPGWNYPKYFSFLSQNCTENAPTDIALFVRVDRGRYILNLNHGSLKLSYVVHNKNSDP